jgi:hypothetical protein
MLIRFYANGGTDFGYKAKVSFLTPESAISRAAKPFTSEFKILLLSGKSKTNGRTVFSQMVNGHRRNFDSL